MIHRTMIFFLTLFALAACQDQGPMEEAGENIDEGIEEAGQAIEEAGHDIEDAFD